jgi:hypothetical protein
VSQGTLEELFDPGDATSSRGAPSPRGALVRALVAVGSLLATTGLAWSSVPGGAVILGAWYVAERDLARIHAGYLPIDAEPDALDARRYAVVGVLGLLVLLAIQAWLLSSGFYHVFWLSIADRLDLLTAR